MNARALLRRMFDAAVAAASPDGAVPVNLPPPPRGRTVVVGAGKAAAAMARAVEAHWPADRPLTGLVVTRYGHGVGPLKRIEVIEASHPVPDAAGQEAARRILDAVRGLGADDLVSASSRAAARRSCLCRRRASTLADKQAVNRALLTSGAAIGEMNCVRKHLSAIKGGRLAAAAAPREVVVADHSDVPGDDPSVIASGPTVARPQHLAPRRSALRRYRRRVPAGRARLARTIPPGDAEARRPGSPASQSIIATPQAALEAAAKLARDAGYRPVILGDASKAKPARSRA